MDSGEVDEIPIKSRVSVDWLEFTLFSRKPEILRDGKMDFLTALELKQSMGGNSDFFKEQFPDHWEKNQKKFEYMPFTALEVCGLLGEYGENPIKQERGAQGYFARHITAAGVVILSEGSPGMGVHVSFTGEVVQAVEDLPGLLLAIKAEGAKFTRIDLAIDDCDRVLDLPLMVQKCRAGECSASSKTFLVMEGGKIKDGEPTGLTLYIGKKISDFMCRIYDKRLESIHEKGVAPGDLPGHWIRAEMECKSVAANNAVLEIIGGEKEHKGQRVTVVAKPLPVVAAGILSNYVNFKDRGADSNKSRWKISLFWDAFIDGAEKLSVSRQILASDLDSQLKWFKRQCSKPLAKLIKTYGNEELVFAVASAEKALTYSDYEQIYKQRRKVRRKRKKDKKQLKRLQDAGEKKESVVC